MCSFKSPLPATDAAESSSGSAGLPTWAESLQDAPLNKAHLMSLTAPHFTDKKPGAREGQAKRKFTEQGSEVYFLLPAPKGVSAAVQTHWGTGSVPLVPRAPQTPSKGPPHVSTCLQIITWWS